jgi:hypothetical protein
MMRFSAMGVTYHWIVALFRLVTGRIAITMYKLNSLQLIDSKYERTLILNIWHISIYTVCGRNITAWNHTWFQNDRVYYKRIVFKWLTKHTHKITIDKHTVLFCTITLGQNHYEQNDSIYIAKITVWFRNKNQYHFETTIKKDSSRCRTNDSISLHNNI